MSNYPNMSYCMCENTALAMRQVIQAMEFEGPMFLKDMNKHEQRAFQDLFNLCETFMNASENLQLEYEEALRDGSLEEEEV